MGFLIGALCVVLLTVFVVQVGKARELASVVRNDPNEEYEINKFHAGLGMIFMIGFLAICIWSFIMYIPTTLGWGPNTAASEHGPSVDYLFNLTLFFTSIVFFITHIALFWFAWKYRGRAGKKALYWAHNETLEMIWMLIPAVVMTFLVVGGLQAWNEIMTDLPEEATSVILPADDAENEFIEIEATGSQFLWYLRYPGRDGKIGTKYFTQINSQNPLGQTWTDEKNMDDFMTNEIVLPVGKKVRVRITARDVLHNFYIRDMRVKMDAVPGMPTYFIFTPTVTTDSMRRRLSQRPEWQVPDENDDTKQRWETFHYELACAELCGRGHYSMRNLVKIVEEDEYLEWLAAKEGGKLTEVEDTTTGTSEFVYEDGSLGAQYFTKIYGSEDDPMKGKTDKLQKLVANKLFVQKAFEDTKAIRDANEEGTEMYSTAQEAMDNIEKHLKVAIITNNMEASNKALSESQAIATSVSQQAASAAPAEEEMTEMSDSTAVEADTTGN